ncbi:MAG: cytochrome C [Cyanophyceae cyanobacterium]
MSHCGPFKRFGERCCPRLAVVGVALAWSLLLGGGMALAFDSSTNSATTIQEPTAAFYLSQAGATAPPDNLRQGRALYLENCASCHIPIPPGVLPTETWEQILENPQSHYGQSLPPILGPFVLLMWDYLRTFSRPLPPNRSVPDYVRQSQYFKALHPRVEMPEPATHQTCINCHPGARALDYRTLSAEWEDAS